MTKPAVHPKPYYVYRVYDDADRLLYVGCTCNPIARRRAHELTGSYWYPYAARFVLRGPLSREDALALEHLQINTLNPAFGRTTEKASQHMRWVKAVARFESDWKTWTIPHEWDADFTTALEAAELEGREYRPEHDLEPYLALRSAA